MKAVVLYGAGDVRVEQVLDPILRLPTDAIVRVVSSCVCGSDLWLYRGTVGVAEPVRIGHEFTGIVEEVGAGVTTVRPGDLVVAPFMYSDGLCDFCESGLQTSCRHGGIWARDGMDGGQGEAVRVPLADGTLVPVPGHDAEALRVSAVPERMRWALLALSDVLGTGHHAALAAGVGAGSRVAVIGDGAVGLSAVLAAHRLGAERITVLGRHPDRLRIARAFGASDEITVRGPEAAATMIDTSDGGYECVLECVGTEDSWSTALAGVRPGGRIGYVGVPHGVSEGLPLLSMFSRNIAVVGGVAPVRHYLPELLADVLAGTIDPSPVFDLVLPLDDAAAGYEAMDARRAIKTGLRVA
jgi:threonine dehydrogenase-like Zn-dependent dehydrogenase